MKKIIILLALSFTACDSITIDYRVGQCMKHEWPYIDIYKVEKRETLKVFMRNLSDKKELIISSMDKGWKDIECPAIK